MILGHTTPSSSILSSKDQDRINDWMEGIGQDLRVGDLPRVGSILAMSALMLAQGFFVDKHAQVMHDPLAFRATGPAPLRSVMQDN